MIRTIGIFGDSFGDDDWVKNDYPSWPELLANDYNIKNYSLSGTSLWYSYKHFKKFNHHDFNIFVVTVPDRLWIPGYDYHVNANAGTWPVVDGINLGEVYYNYIYDDAREHCFHDLMINDVLKSDNTLVIAAFGESIPNYPYWSLCHLAKAEQRDFGLDSWSGFNDRRKCHLTEGNNLVVYRKILESIQNNDKFLKLTENDYVKPTRSIETYWKEENEQ